jgi:drug/metabolite transporter (DMT)-like permease
MKMGNNTRGYILACVASCTYGLNPLFAKPLYAVGLDVSSVLCYRYALAATILAVIMLVRRVSFKVERRILPHLIAAGVLFALSSITLFASYNYMDVGIASTILYVTPVFVALVQALFFHQRLSKVAMVTILVAMVGIALLSIKTGSTMHSPTGIMLVSLSALAYALYMVLVNKSGLKDLTSLSLTFYSILIGIGVFAINLNFFRDIVPLPTQWSPWLNVVGLAIFPTIISIVTTAMALRYIGAQSTSILGALEPLTALVVGCAVFGEMITPLNDIGILLVIGAVTLLTLFNHKD